MIENVLSKLFLNIRKLNKRELRFNNYCGIYIYIMICSFFFVKRSIYLYVFFILNYTRIHLIYLFSLSYLLLE